MQNIELVRVVCQIMDELAPGRQAYENLINFVTDRPGHDQRYAIDASKIRRELGWQPKENFKSGLRKTILWYLQNKSWWHKILSGDFNLQRMGKL